MSCPKCNKMKRSELKGFEEFKEKQRKRYGSVPCNNCLIELMGGQEVYEKEKQNQILKEMGIEKSSNK